MEHHRLKPMTKGYDKQLFDKLYHETAALRKKLAYQIDHRKFGVDYKEILSWFDVKFIHVFNKYCKTDPERLMGYIINGLQTYKYRVMRSSYQAKYHTHAHMLDIDNLYGHPEACVEDNIEPLEREHKMNIVMDFMKKQLSNDALLLLEVQLNPPPYIIAQLKDEGRKDKGTIPADIITDYLGLGQDGNAISYIRSLRREITNVTIKAKEHFELHSVHFSPPEFSQS